MKFEIYCDECRPDLFSSQLKAPSFLSIGSLWIPAEQRNDVKLDILKIRQKHGIWGELKWNKISSGALNLYIDIIKYFFSNDQLRFRTIIVDSSKIDLVRFHDGDAELGFYKFYYQLLHHWILDFNEYTIFVDMKTNRLPNRLSTLKEVLNRSNLTSSIKSVQSLKSKEVVLIQICDLLTGAVNSKFNTVFSSENKKNIIEMIENKICRMIGPTQKCEEKFNVFKIQLKGGW